ncbi:MAG: hypothetical protein JXA46_14070 [Dehalococcoidales bacterium]|nr:hypothetical protein [Dehalococcoidales bacterium]
MRLPNTVKAIIDAEKIRDYLLSPTHPVGQFKSAVFYELGYSQENWETFEENLRNLILSCDVEEVEETRYGRKFIVEGPFTGPSGRTMQIVTVWIILNGDSIPRFVTAYPGGVR